VQVRELPGVRAAGPSADVAVERAEAAMRAWIAEALDSGAHIPEPASEKPDFYSGHLRLQLPISLHRELAQRAAAEQVSVAQLAIHLLSRGLSAPPARPQQGQRPNNFRRNQPGRGGRQTPADMLARSNVFAGRGLDANRRGNTPFDRGDRHFRDS
jgi:predicted RNase H-like HicB family nuclease